MAKKVYAFDEDIIEENGGIKAKKKRNKCLTCCIVALVVVLSIFLIVFVVAWILGDKYTKQLFDMSMGETLGVVSDMYWTDDDDVVTRPFTKKDLDGFYKEIKRNILLKDDVNIDFDSALNAAIDNYLGIESKAMALNASGDEGEGEDDSEIINIFVDMIAGVLHRDNIDMERLNKYDATKPEEDEYIFNLNDKQLAAFINTILTKVLKNADKMDGLSDISDMIKLDKVLALKQIRFTAKSQKTEDGNTEIKAASADITVWVGLQEAAGQAIDKYMRDAGVGWASGIVRFFGDIILPKNLYLTVSFPLQGEDNTAYIVINDMDAKERARANKLINGILKMMNGEDSLTLDEAIDSFIADIKPTLKEVTDNMDFTNANSGSISLDLLDSVAKMASEEAQEPLTKADFLYVLQALFSDSTAQLNALIPYRYENWYDVDGTPKYLPDGHATAQSIDYEKEFIREIEAKYAIDFDEDEGITGVLEMLGISLDGEGGSSVDSKDLLGKMNGDRFDALLDKSISDIKLHITDRMLGAALSQQMDKIGSAGDMSDLDMQLIALTFIEKPGRENHMYAQLAVMVNLDGMIASMSGDGDSFIAKLATGLMPENILLTVVVDITRGIPDASRDKAEFVINSCGAAKTETVLATLEKLVPDLKFGDVSDEIGKTLNDMLSQMDEQLNIELVASDYSQNDSNDWVGTAGALVMPDVFSVITDKVLVSKNPDGSAKKELTADELKAIVRDLNNPADIKAASAKDDCEDFITQVFSKYYLKSADKPIKTFDELSNYLNKFDTDMLRVDGRNGIAHDTTDINGLHPVMSSAELFGLLKDKMSADTAQTHDILNVTTGKDILHVTLAIKLDQVLKNAKEISKIIRSDKLYVVATFYTDSSNIIGSGTSEDPYGYKVETSIKVKDGNGYKDMEDGTYQAMLRLIKFYSSDFNINNQVKEFGVTLYNQIHTLNSSMGGNDNHEVFNFTADGLELTDFYTFLALKMEPTLLDDYTNEDIRETVQGLYEYESAYANDYNFDKNEIIRNKPSAKGSSKWGIPEMLTLNNTPHIDKDFNGFLKQGVERIGGEGAVTVEQTMILAKGDTRGGAASVRNMLNSRLKLDVSDKLTTDDDYLIITFSMGMRAFAGGDNSAKGMFPDRIYATVVYKYHENGEAGNKFSVVGGIDEQNAPVLVFNNMEGKQYEIMVRLMDANPKGTGDANDPNKINIKTVALQGATVLNGMSQGGASIEFSKSEEINQGFGIIEIKTNK